MGKINKSGVIKIPRITAQKFKKYNITNHTDLLKEAILRYFYDKKFTANVNQCLKVTRIRSDKNAVTVSKIGVDYTEKLHIIATLTDSTVASVIECLVRESLRDKGYEVEENIQV